jgi:hypothetical protein
MNDFDLEAKLNAVQIPERTEEYWDDFPSRVRVQLGRTIPQESARWQGGLQWRWGLAMAGVLFVLSLAPVLRAAVKDEQALRRDAEKFPQKVHALMADEHGMQNLITDSE